MPKKHRSNRPRQHIKVQSETSSIKEGNDDEMFILGQNDHVAKIFLRRQYVDKETIKQIGAMTLHPSIGDVAIMPDCHKGNGCCVGFTSRLRSSVLPGVIGGDIGCGIAMHALPPSCVSHKNSLKRIDSIIKEEIPVGNGWEKINQISKVSFDQYETFFADAQIEAAEFAQQFESRFGEDISVYMPHYSLEWLRGDLSRRIGADFESDMRTMGTLGGGNHYIEINESNADTSAMYLSVHTGSRSLGQKIASYHHARMLESSSSKFVSKTSAGEFQGCVVSQLEKQKAVASCEYATESREIHQQPIASSSCPEGGTDHRPSQQRDGSLSSAASTPSAAILREILDMQLIDPIHQMQDRDGKECDHEDNPLREALPEEGEEIGLIGEVGEANACRSRDCGPAVGPSPTTVSAEEAQAEINEAAVDAEKAAMHESKTDRNPVQTQVSDDTDTTGVDPSLAGLSGAMAAEYFFDMIWAQTWAKMNRRAILSTILHRLGVPYDSASIIESVHNYIDFRDLLIRKGAVSAREGELCIVSLNMRDGVLLCRGKGNPEWNWSAPHGCGRILSRRSAAAAVSRGSKDLAAAMKKFHLEMGEVYSTCVMPETLDERPSAYRDKEIICEALAPTADIVCQARTLLNVKGF